jgi:ABC-type methionine transport system ATPase subunit
MWTACQQIVYILNFQEENAMNDNVVRLIYPSSLLKVPVINQLLRRYDITLNILQAQIDTEQGWIEVQLAGNPVVIDEAIKWLNDQGVEVQINTPNTP